MSESKRKRAARPRKAQLLDDIAACAEIVKDLVGRIKRDRIGMRPDGSVDPGLLLAALVWMVCEVARGCRTPVSTLVAAIEEVYTTRPEPS